MERPRGLMSKIGGKAGTETTAWGWRIPKFTTDSLQYRERFEMAMTDLASTTASTPSGPMRHSTEALPIATYSDLNASRLPWLQIALAKDFMADRRDAQARKAQK